MIYGSLEYHFDASEGSVHLRNLKIGGRKRRIGRNGALGERTPLGTAIDVEQVRRASDKRSPGDCAPLPPTLETQIVLTQSPPLSY